jgi:hypothetical protein
MDGDVVRTRYYEYSRKKLEALLCKSLDDVCLPAVLDAKNSYTCPTPDEDGHEDGGHFHECKGKDLWALGTKRADVDIPQSRGKGLLGFARPAGK